MVMKRRAQAALEYLMTYGWALLVILIVFIALYLMGVLKPKMKERIVQPFENFYVQGYILNKSGNVFKIAIKNIGKDPVVLRRIKLQAIWIDPSLFLEAEYNLPIGIGNSTVINVTDPRVGQCGLGKYYKTMVMLEFQRYTEWGLTNYTMTDTAEIIALCK